MLSIRQSFKTGISFGLTSGIITTLGLMVGLQSGTNSKIVVLGGVLFIAIADAMSDSLGIHISEESKKGFVVKEVWESTIATFITKFITALIFIIPILLFSLGLAVVINVFWGLFLIIVFNFYVAKQDKQSPFGVIFEHLLIAVLVIAVTHYLGSWVSTLK